MDEFTPENLSDRISEEASRLTVEKIVEAPPVEHEPTLRERLDERLEELRVRWFMLDAQSKQAIVLVAIYLGYALIDMAAAFARIAKERQE